MLNIKTNFLKLISLLLLAVLTGCGGGDADKKTSDIFSYWQGDWTNSAVFYQDPKTDELYDKLAEKVPAADAKTIKRFHHQRFKTGEVAVVRFSAASNKVSYLNSAGAVIKEVEYELVDDSQSQFKFHATNAADTIYEYLVIGKPHGSTKFYHWHGMFADTSFANVAAVSAIGAGTFYNSKLTLADYLESFADETKLERFADRLNKADGAFAKWLAMQPQS